MPPLIVLDALSSLRFILNVVGSVIVIFTGTVPRALFGAITMTYRYEWRVLSYIALFDDTYPPFEFMPAGADDGRHPHAALEIAYPERLTRWKPLCKWFLAIPHYVVCFVLAVAAVFALLGSAVAVVVTGRYPARLQRFLVRAFRYVLRVQAYVGPLTDQYPRFALAQ